MNEPIQVPAKIEPESREEPGRAGNDHPRTDYQLDCEDCVPEEAGYGYGV